jgi:hypothetical protein
MSKSSLDEKERIHRYKVWLLAQDNAVTGGPHLLAPKAATASKPINKLTDLETLLLLYNYGRPMDIAVEGVFSLPNGQSGMCTTKKVSSESVAFAYTAPNSYSPAMPNLRTRVGSPVSLDLDVVGTFGGVLTAENEDGFEVAVNKENRTAVSTKLAHIAVKRGIGVESTYTVEPGAVRIEPTHKDCLFTDHTGTLKKGLVVNLSHFDALIRTAPANIPPLGARIVIRGPEWHGAEAAIVFEIGFIAKFCIPIPAHKFSTELRFAAPPRESTPRSIRVAKM